MAHDTNVSHFPIDALLQGWNAAITRSIKSQWEVMGLKRGFCHEILWFSVMQEVRPYVF